VDILTSDQWLARIGLVLALAATEVVLAAICGADLIRLIVLAIAALIFVIAYVVAPSPGKRDYDAAAFRPIHAMRAATVLAVAATGGYASPLLPLVAVPVAMAWTMARPNGREVALAVLALAILIALSPSLPFSPTGVATLAAWSTLLATWAIGRRIVQLLDFQRSQAMCLSRVREGALVDAEDRRRGM